MLACLELQRRRVPSVVYNAVPEIGGRLQMMGESIKANGNFLRGVLTGLGLQPLSQQAVKSKAEEWTAERISDFPFGWVSGMLVQLVSEWSDQGAPERKQRFKPAVDALRKAIPPPPPGSQWKHRPRILVPGAGLGRMVWDLGSLGYDVVGVEVAITMNLVSDYLFRKVLPEHCRRAAALSSSTAARGGELGIYPGVLEPLGPNNKRRSSDIFSQVTIPGSDVGTGPTGHVQIIQGDGNIVSTMEPGTFDAVRKILGSNAGSTRTPSTLPPYVGP